MISAVFDFDSTMFVEEAIGHLPRGIQLSLATLLLTLILEIMCMDTVKKLLKQPGAGIRLYRYGIWANFRNHLFFGAPLYAVASTLYCRPDDDEVTLTDRVVRVMTILVVHSFLFYALHRAFHEYPSLYKHHRFHHRFNVHVPPSAANAVSPVEYIFAYIVPFIIAMVLCEPDTLSLRVSVATVSVTNIMLHSPVLCEWSKSLPEWVVSTEDHLVHHRKLNTKYAAPTFNVDYLVEVLTGPWVTPMTRESTNADELATGPPLKSS